MFVSIQNLRIGLPSVATVARTSVRTSSCRRIGAVHPHVPSDLRSCRRLRNRRGSRHPRDTAAPWRRRLDTSARPSVPSSNEFRLGEDRTGIGATRLFRTMTTLLGFCPRAVPPAETALERPHTPKEGSRFAPGVPFHSVGPDTPRLALRFRSSPRFLRHPLRGQAPHRFLEFDMARTLDIAGDAQPPLEARAQGAGR